MGFDASRIQGDLNEANKLQRDLEGAQHALRIGNAIDEYTKQLIRAYSKPMEEAASMMARQVASQMLQSVQEGQVAQLDAVLRAIPQQVVQSEQLIQFKQVMQDYQKAQAEHARVLIQNMQLVQAEQLHRMLNPHREVVRQMLRAQQPRLKAMIEEYLANLRFNMPDLDIPVEPSPPPPSPEPEAQAPRQPPANVDAWQWLFRVLLILELYEKAIDDPGYVAEVMEELVRIIQRLL